MTKTATVQPLECCHADTCFPCYWSGHHLPHVQVPVWRGMTLAQIKRSILSELAQDAIAGSEAPAYDDPTADAWHRRACAAVRRMKPARKGQRRFFLDLPPDDGDLLDESVYAFFVFRPLEA